MDKICQPKHRVSVCIKKKNLGRKSSGHGGGLSPGCTQSWRSLFAQALPRQRLELRHSSPGPPLGHHWATTGTLFTGRLLLLLLLRAPGLLATQVAQEFNKKQVLIQLYFELKPACTRFFHLIKGCHYLHNGELKAIST